MVSRVLEIFQILTSVQGDGIFLSAVGSSRAPVSLSPDPGCPLGPRPISLLILIYALSLGELILAYNFTYQLS